MMELKKMTDGDNRFVIHGAKYGEELIPFLQIADFTLVPTLCYENLPQTILESFSFGTPVVAARIGGIRELVVDNKNGFLFEAGDEENLRAVLDKVLAIMVDDYSRLVEGVGEWRGLNTEEYIGEIIRMLKY